MQKIKLKIQAERDRENMVIALANNGYKVWIEEASDNVCKITYFVVFELQ